MSGVLDLALVALNRATSLWQVLPARRGDDDKLRVLLLTCHPVADSFSAACARATAAGLHSAGHEVRWRTLYHVPGVGAGQPRSPLQPQSYGGSDFSPALTAAERSGYYSIAADSASGLSPQVAEAVDDLRWAQALVLVYPTWWFNVPATLKGWCDRVLLPHVAFRLPKQTVAGDPGPTETGLQPLLTDIQKLGVVTTYGAPQHIVMAAGDNGRRMFSHGLRPLMASTCTLRWLGLHCMDDTTVGQRAAFLKRVSDTFEKEF